MRRIISIVLLGALLYNTAGYFLVFQVLRWQVKQQVVNRLQHRAEVPGLLVMEEPAGAEGFTFEEENEFSYRGQLYDVVKTTTHNGHTRYYCINDREEGQLLASYRQQADEDGNSPDKHAKQLHNLLLKDITQPEEKTTLPEFISQHLTFPGTTPGCGDPACSLSTPPPRA